MGGEQGRAFSGKEAQVLRTDASVVGTRAGTKGYDKWRRGTGATGSDGTPRDP